MKRLFALSHASLAPSTVRWLVVVVSMMCHVLGMACMHRLHQWRVAELYKYSLPWQYSANGMPQLTAGITYTTLFAFIWV